MRAGLLALACAGAEAGARVPGEADFVAQVYDPAAGTARVDLLRFHKTHSFIFSG